MACDKFIDLLINSPLSEAVGKNYDEASYKDKQKNQMALQLSFVIIIFINIIILYLGLEPCNTANSD